MNKKEIKERIKKSEKQLNLLIKLKEQHKKELKIAKKSENKDATKYFKKLIKSDNELIANQENYLKYLKTIEN